MAKDSKYLTVSCEKSKRFPDTGWSAPNLDNKKPLFEHPPKNDY